jgi:hypothetical protein
MPHMAYNYSLSLSHIQTVKKNLTLQVKSGHHTGTPFETSALVLQSYDGVRAPVTDKWISQ